MLVLVGVCDTRATAELKPPLVFTHNKMDYRAFHEPQSSRLDLAVCFHHPRSIFEDGILVGNESVRGYSLVPTH